MDEKTNTKHDGSKPVWEGKLKSDNEKLANEWKKNESMRWIGIGMKENKRK